MIALYAVRHRDDSVRASSASGGAFRALCAHTVSLGGVVYGAMYDSDMRVVHGRATTLDECSKFSGSKYVQSDMGSCFASITADLEAAGPVLFSGTPCQVHALTTFLSVKKCTGPLLTADVICHGVPSPRLWRDHVELVERRTGARMIGYLFRDKRIGWRGGHRCAITERGDLRGPVAGAFGEVFDHGYALRPSCHECPFTDLNRCADITMGDYWGVERHHPELDDDRGVSLVLVNSALGMRTFDSVRDSLECVALEVNQCVQPNLQRPTPPSKHRDAFWATYERSGYEGAIRRYTSFGLVRRLARRARAAMRTHLGRISRLRRPVGDHHDRSPGRSGETESQRSIAITGAPGECESLQVEVAARGVLTLFQCKSECCGCAACEAICPVQAIVMSPDSEGFVYPSIDPARCTACQRCVSVCPIRRRRSDRSTDELSPNAADDVRELS